MATGERCPRCGAALTAGAPLGLCPACLLKAGLEAPTDGPTMDTGSGEGEAPTYEARPANQPARGGGAPDHVGPYHILGVLGEGGMGIVYLAEQREPIARRVALKLVKPGMDSREVLRRFEAERQALALMDHPHIARVLDAGIGPGGTPYFVMEYVPGLTITDYCDRHRLTNAERLELFLPVCAAIQHAHQKGVIHRDLKPSNILVAVQDGKPVPKIIDFGIAKATHRGVVERAAFTELGMLIGTPEYMSPEQAEASGLEVDTTTDIYSLGVILYELLVGALPFDPVALRQAGFTEIHRIIREQDPPKPSTRASTLGATAEEVAKRHQTNPGGLARQVRGDLDAITMKALEKDRTRRYASASEFAADLQRYLRGEAVVARPASVAYRTRKFVRRHKVGVAAGALVAAALVVGLALSTMFYIRSEGARRAEERQRVVAERRGCQAAMLAADFSLRAGAASDARARLEDCTEPLRGWEWRVLDRQTSASALTFEVDGSSRSVAFQDDATIRALVLGTRGGKERLRLITGNLASPGADLTTSPEESVIALSPDGRLAVVTNALSGGHHAYNDRSTGLSTLEADTRGGQTTADRFVQVRDIASGRTLAQLDVAGLGKWTGPRRERITVGVYPVLGGDRASAMDPDTGEIVVTASGVLPYLVDASFSADGTRVAAWSWGNVIGIWDTASGRQIASLKGHSDGVTAVAFTPDAGRLVSASFDGNVRVWSLAEARPLAVLPVPGGVWALAASPDGRWIAAGSANGTIRLWDAPRFNLVWSAALDRSAISALAFSPDGVMLASGDRGIRLWDAATGAGLAVTRPHRGAIDALAFNSEGSRLLSSGADQTLRVTNLADAELRVIGRHGEPATAAVFAPDSETIVSGGEDRTMRVWRASTGRLIRTMQAPEPADATYMRYDNRMAFAASRDGRLVAAGFENDTAVYVWDTATGDRVRTLAGHEDGVGAVTFTLDGRRLVVVSGDGQTRIWDVATGGLAGRMAYATRVLVPLRSPLSLLSAARSVRVLNLEPIRLDESFAWMDGAASCAAVDDGNAHAMVGTASGSLTLLDLRGASPARVLKASGSALTSCAYRPDGRRVAAAFSDGTIGLWDTDTLELILTLVLDSAFATPKKPSDVSSGSLLSSERVNYARSVAFSPDGSKLATAWSDGAIRIWNASPKSAGQRARDVVDASLERIPLADEVVSALEVEPGLTPEIRAEALRQAQGHFDDPSALNSAAWKVVRDTGGSAPAYSRALSRAQKASAALPIESYLNTLGVAQYRTGAYRDAVATLEKCAGMRQHPNAADLAFLAMAHQRVGNGHAAREALEKLRAEMEKPANATNEEFQGFLHEAEALIEGKAASPVKK